jgi:Zn-dependent protease
MRDPLTWSLPLGRLFGIAIRVHVFFPVVALALILRIGFKTNYWAEACELMALLFVAVLLHEFGHCFAARFVDGDAHEILIWPLGGLAFIEVPHTPRANFIAAAGGPLVNVLLCLSLGLGLTAVAVRPPFNPWWELPWDRLYGWDGQPVAIGSAWVLHAARFFWINWLLTLLNVVLIGFPMDAGRMFQCALWPRLGFRQATLAAIFAGFITMLVVAIYAIVQEDVLFLCLALFIYATCRQQYIILETGGDEGLFGYDFSQGYTSLEREQPRRPRRPNVLQRWLQRRAQRKLQREQETRELEERRMDELLEKVQREGLQALTDEERRFLTRVSAKYRNRQ